MTVLKLILYYVNRFPSEFGNRSSSQRPQNSTSASKPAPCSKPETDQTSKKSTPTLSSLLPPIDQQKSSLTKRVSTDQVDNTQVSKKAKFDVGENETKSFTSSDGKKTVCITNCSNITINF